MDYMTPTARASIQQVLARGTGMAAAIYGYPLVEMVRICRLHTGSIPGYLQLAGAPIDVLHHSAHLPTDWTGALRSESMRYTTAWIHLDDGPRYLWTPPASALPECPYILTFYDACSEKIVDISHEAVSSEGIVICGPQTAAFEAVDGRIVVQSSTNLVWMVCRALVDAKDPMKVFVLNSMTRLDGPPDTLWRRRPAAVELWEGEPTDAFVEIAEQGLPAATLAPVFFANLCRALAHIPCRVGDRATRAQVWRTGLVPGPSLDWDSLEPSVRDGLVEGLEDAALSVCAAAAHSRISATTALTLGDGRGNYFLERAIAARRGPGAMSSTRP